MLCKKSYRAKVFIFSFTALALMIFSVPAAIASTTTVSLTTVDSDGIAWANGTYSLLYMAPTGWDPGNVHINNLPFAQYFSGTMDSTGSATITGVPDVNSMYPTGGTWKI